MTKTKHPSIPVAVAPTVQYEVRVYGKNRKERGGGKPSFWSNIDAWVAARKKITGKEPVTVNVMSSSAEPWSRELSPMVLGPVAAYAGRTAVSVEVAWQYSRVYSRVLQNGKLMPTEFAHPDGSPTPQWFAWRDYNWGRAEFRHTHADFKKHKDVIRRAFPKGSVSLWYWDGHMLDRVTARREIYARLYLQYAVKTAAWQQLQTLCKQGDVLIYDNDGYDDIALGMTPEQTLLTPDHPWGHGTLLAFVLRGIDPLKQGPLAVRIPVKDLMKPKPLPKDAIILTKSANPNGWMNCMNNKYPIVDGGTDYPSAEHWFLCQRFPGNAKFHEGILRIKGGSPCKRWVRSQVEKGNATPTPLRDQADLDRMRLVLCMKLQQHPQLIHALLGTRKRMIAEDCTKRPEEQEVDGTTVTVPFWGIKIDTDGTYVGESHLGRLWMKIRDELRTTGKSIAVSPQGDIVVQKDASVPAPNPWLEPEILDEGVLTKAEEDELKTLKAAIQNARTEAEKNFQDMASACHEIFEKRLYRGAGTFAQYFRKEFGWERAHAYRIIQCGRLIAAQRSAILADCTSQAHFRPLLATRDDTKVSQVLGQIEAWRKQLPELQISPKVVESAAQFIDPPTPSPWKGRRLDATAVLGCVTEALKHTATKSPATVIKQLHTEIHKMAFGRVRVNGIEWSDRSWNPVHGCDWKSKGCDFCYAATLLGTRLAGRFPGLVDKKGATYRFNGTVRIDVAALSEPLEVRIPSKIFVNSLSDLFHASVPDWFLDACFHVMEQATWHEFQILTKRPERMAKYTNSRYKDKSPPPHLWLGATMEDQSSHDLRMPYLQSVKTAIRWVSVEPLLGPLKLDTNGLHWVVVGGESGSTRETKKAWVDALQKQCTAKSIPFFFKQWEYRLEDGTLASRAKGDEYKLLGGNFQQAFPA